MKFPNLLFVGAEKAGSTTIHRVLSEHKDIYSIRKETEFFSFYNKKKKRDYYLNSSQEYLQLFNNSDNFLYRLDVSTTYLHCPEAIKNIKKLAGSIKIIICLRNPIDRAYSRYWMSAKKNFDLTYYSKEKFLNYFFNHKTDISWSNVRNRGLYSLPVDKFIKAFGEKQILVLFYDELLNNKSKFFERIFDFLEIDTMNIPKFNKYAESLYSNNKVFHTLFNSSLKVKLPDNRLVNLFKYFFRKLRSFFLKKYPKIGKEEKMVILNYYLRDIEKLEKKLNINLKSWKN